MPIKLNLTLIDREQRKVEEAKKAKRTEQKVKSTVKPVFIGIPPAARKTPPIKQKIENPTTFNLYPLDNSWKKAEAAKKKPTSMSEIKIPGPGGG